mmetsp:Transcript_12214/g.36286  ORF Transcript_12214/g.36286 Transcript_12214/m.36286 type:complete len:321 (+) Transcript_12214:199-1161(+)
MRVVVLLLSLGTSARALLHVPVAAGHQAFPLDVVRLDVPTEAWARASLESGGGPALLGLTEQRPEPGARGVLCEVARAAAAGGVTEVRGVAVGRFDVAECSPARPGGLDVAGARPVVDAEPEQDAVLREDFDLLARRPALRAEERRLHLRVLEMAQLLRWDPRRAQNSSPTAAEDLAAVQRFAPDAIALVEGAADCCAVDAASDACLLERAFAAASADEVDAARAEEVAAFTPGRAELYSWAVARALGPNEEDTRTLLATRSTAFRLRFCLEGVTATSAWLARRQGLGDLHAGVAEAEPAEPLPPPKLILRRLLRILSPV